MKRISHITKRIYLAVTVITIVISLFSGNPVRASASSFNDEFGDLASGPDDYSEARDALEAAGYDMDDLSGLQPFIYRSFSGSSATTNLLQSAKKDMQIGNYSYQIILTVYKALLPFALGVVLIYWLIDLIQKSSSFGSRGELNEKFIFAAFVKLLISEWLLCEGDTLLIYICALGNAFLNEIGNLSFAGIMVSVPSTGSMNTGYTNLFLVIKELGILEQLSMILPAILLNFANAICSLAIRFQTIAKKVELILMGCFSGVAFAACLGESTRGASIGYLKKYIACGLHAASILLILKITDAMSADLLVSHFVDKQTTLAYIGSGFSTLLMPFLYKFAAIGSISVAKSIINDAFQ